MKNTLILAGAAALAFTAPVLAQPGKGGGGGNGNGGGKGGPPAQMQQGGGGGQQARGGGNGGGGGPKEMRGGGGQREARGGGGPQMRGNGNGGGGGPKEMRGGGQREARGGGGPQMRGNGNGNGGGAKMRGPERREVRQAERQQQQRGPVREARGDRGPAQKGNGNQRIAQDRGPVQFDGRLAQRQERGDRNYFRTEQRQAYLASPNFRTTGLVDGCPPGLAAKGNGCLPPGQAKKLVGAAIPVALGSALLPTYYRDWYPDNDDYYYRTQDGYVYRVDRDRNYVDAYWPLADDWNGAYYVGAAYPQDYLGYYNVPAQYQPWYADNNDSYYRYGDGAIYQVDRGNGLIEGIVSLLAGGFGVGQPMPAGYDVYNVPYDYRDQYVDNADHMYRYNDGYIYDVDPTTQIVQAIVESLV